MLSLNVDFNKVTGKIKPMHGVGQPPFQGIDFSMTEYLAKAGVPFSRLHDVGGMYGNNVFVDIPNLFRDFSADETDPDSYDFAFTDLLMKALDENGIEPFFRLGVTIENYHKVKAYNIYPPADNLKWAKICEGIIKHYTQGWANGYFYDIKYWEIWNEPDNEPEIENNSMWKGTKEQYFELYKTASVYLKSKFPDLKIGGYSSCGFYAMDNGRRVKAANSSERAEYFIEFFEDFLEFVRENNCPLDFFSWHSYDNIQKNKAYAAYARQKLDEYGFTKTESICNEWNCSPESRGTAMHAAIVCAMMVMFQNTSLDSAMFYDARFGTSIYGGLFNPLTEEPFPAYYGFCAYNELYKLENQIECTPCDADGIYCMAAAKGNKKAVLIVNTNTDDTELNTDFTDEFIAYITDGSRNMEKYCTDGGNVIIPKESFVLFKSENR